MADKSDIYHFELRIVDEACAVDENRKLTVACHPSETPEHTVMRVMAYAMFWQPGMEMAGTVCQGEQPDLIVEQHAIIVGIGNHKRIRKAARRYPRLSCLEWRLAQMDRASVLCQQIEADGATATIIGLDGSIGDLLEDVQRRNRWQIHMTDEGIDVETGQSGHVFHTRTLCRL